ncbi:M15 family metallopeptidase [uncultured Nocardioides sp.]|uniref:M15 family metallopeptidase n=1 Tax=uncultured Nocardioides sp. TaxID=198441 RepID=UPI00261953B7|nr:M15 family metallopeptidase [uncultured Nocardioides sp.]
MGTRPLPLRSDGYGRAGRTPRALDPRRFTLPDTARPLSGTGFAAVVEAAPADVLERSTWAPGCPVAVADLAYVRLAFWGFDDRRHTGELLVNASVADDLVSVFRALYRERFPFEELRITRPDELDARPTGDGNVTGAFVCRPTTGSTSTFSQHAYGLAIDLDPFQNPYVKGDLVLPELASSYADRGRLRPGMITPDSVVVREFARVGWTWGGSWRSLKDYQHFSQNGR